MLQDQRDGRMWALALGRSGLRSQLCHLLVVGEFLSLSEPQFSYCKTEMMIPALDAQTRCIVNIAI